MRDTSSAIRRDSAALSPWLSGPNATSSITVLQKSWSSGSWKTNPTSLRYSAAFRSLTSRPSIQTLVPDGRRPSLIIQWTAWSCRIAPPAPDPAINRSSVTRACSCPHHWDRPAQPTHLVRSSGRRPGARPGHQDNGISDPQPEPPVSGVLPSLVAIVVRVSFVEAVVMPCQPRAIMAS